MTHHNWYLLAKNWSEVSHFLVEQTVHESFERDQIANYQYEVIKCIDDNFYCFILAQPLTLFFCILFANQCCVFSEAHHKNNFFIPTRMHRTRHTQTLLLPRGAQIKIEYNLRRPSIRTIVRQVEALGYTVLVRPFWGRQEVNSQGFTSQCLGAHLLLIYPPPFNHQRNEEEFAREQNDQVHIESVEVEITDDLFKNSVVLLL